MVLMMRVPPRVHPRVCGGAPQNAKPMADTKGPSPRVRGSPLQRRDRRDQRGSIPACAGEPLSPRPIRLE